MLIEKREVTLQEQPALPCSKALLLAVSIIYWTRICWHTVCGCFCTVIAELRSCDRDCVWPAETEYLLYDPLQKKFANPWSTGLADPLKQLSKTCDSQVSHQFFTQDKVPQRADLNATHFIHFFPSPVELLGMSGMIALVAVGLNLDSLSFKPRIEIIITK